MSSDRGPGQDVESNLKSVFILLFEESDVIQKTLVPELLVSLGSEIPLAQPADFDKVVDESIRLIHRWSPDLQAQFIAGHPRIGETKNLSVLSSKEQSGGTSAAVPTPPEVLLRLQHLNACYEHVYPGLRYITFVNGRSRATIAEEMEDKLGIRRSLLPDQPPVESLVPVEANSQPWLAELHRAVEDVGRIAKSRLEKIEREGFLQLRK
ncbi:Oxo-4-hydroxy-4-carboxy-5-ureidoimidazoline decarboxylase [Pisolithus croceorrhizus]|nr:Oxo-4-hydroxy-4-carboxy-5-ureidoimidazoline decarboxylase [Pisolithus croceorrhizus]KAI6122670.1 Oxo-4-hydroxy-4-carboxy-5-ureidoimidazoline decarboxylase [Pisolithus croceorrhizus]